MRDAELHTAFFTSHGFKEIKFCTEVVGKLFEGLHKHRLTCVLICYMSQISLHVALYHTGFLEIVQIHFKKKKF